MLDGIECPALGFCYDSGHDLIWSDTPYEPLSRYGERLFVVRLHDNRGRADDHLAPGEGKADWSAVREGLAGSA